MRIFAFSNTTNNIPIPTGELPVDDDGYLYVLAFGQSNMTGGYPTDVNDPDYLNHGDKTNPVQSYYGNLGEWQPLTYGTGPIRANGNNIAITFCKEMERLYNVKIRLIHSWAGGRGIECWDEDYTNTDEMYTELFARYSAFKRFGQWQDNFRKASIVLMMQGEANTTETTRTPNTTIGYVNMWDKVMDKFVSNEWIKPKNEIYFIGGEICIQDGVIDPAFELIEAKDSKYKFAHSDGVKKDNFWHYDGSGHEEMGKRMVARLGQVCLGETPPISDERPPLPVTTYTDLTTDNITINWDGVSHVNNIVSYEIMRDVYVIDTVAPTERSYITGWDVEIGEFQIFSVLAVDEYGNRSRHKQGGGDQAIRP